MKINKQTAIWLPVGAGIGVALGASIGEIGFGLALGAGIGVALGSMRKTPDSDGEADDASGPDVPSADVPSAEE
jgi:hypothetical protein